MTDLKGLTVGQELYFVPSSKYSNHTTVKVEKVGRKWASLSNRLRIDLETMEADGAGYNSPGRAWLSKEVYDADAALNAAWRDLRNDIYKLWAPPVGVTVPAINNLRRSVGLEVQSLDTGGGEV